MEKPKQSNISILKFVLIIMPIVFVLLIIWLAFVYFGNTYLHLKVGAGQYLLWLISGIIIFIIYPIISKIYLSRWISKKRLWNAVIDIPKLEKTDWLFFIFLHLIGMSLLFWIFSDIQTHLDIYNYFVDHFGKGRRGRPRFPIMIFFITVPILFFSAIYLIATKLMYGTFNEPKFKSNLRNNNFRQKRTIYFSFAVSTSVAIMLCYLLKITLMV